MSILYNVRIILVFCALVLSFTVSTCGRAQTPEPAGASKTLNTALDRYIAREEPVYRWEKSGERQIGENLVTTLQVTSQSWQGITWRHKVEIVRPERNNFPEMALLYLSGANSALESMLTQSLAGRIGVTVIHVMGMPNQPLWEMREDDLIAHSFAQYIKTDDETWPLLLPMTKGAVKAMDAVQEYSAQQKQPLEKFIVTGASKRGWTTWLVGATDTRNRVAGIIPIVYDNLNLEAQLPHQLESWGEYSPMIADYTRRGLQELLGTPKGKELTAIVDPYTYRERFTMPKFIVNGTNDPYWTTDALNLYWNDLPEPKQIYYAPNSGHMLEGNYEPALGTLVAWFKKVAANEPVPNPKLEAEPADASGKTRYRLKTDGTVTGARLWKTGSATRDFRKARWEAVPMQLQKETSESAGAESTFALELPAKDAENTRFSGAFAEVEIASPEGLPLRVSTPIIIRPIGGR